MNTTAGITEPITALVVCKELAEWGKTPLTPFDDDKMTVTVALLRLTAIILRAQRIVRDAEQEAAQ